MRDVILVLGKTGTGKSYLVNKMLRDYKRKIIIDAMEEYEDGIIFSSFFDLSDYLSNYSDSEKFSLICRFDNDIEIESTFELCKIVGNLCLICEEAGLYISPASRSTTFLDLCNYGRHHNVSIIAIARRAPEISAQFRALMTKAISFKQTLPMDLQVMNQFGFTNLENLPEYQYQEIFF